MKIDSLIWNEADGWKLLKSEIEDKNKATIVFIFGTSKEIQESNYFDEIRKIYPNAILVGGSSAGTIRKDELIDNGIIASVLHLEKSRVKLAIEEISETKDSFNIGEKIVHSLLEDDLKHIIVFSDGVNINGSRFVQGLNFSSNHIPISGGILAEESQTFDNAFVIANRPAEKSITVGIGFYGNIESFSGSDSGWDDFGAERIITKSSGNTVYEIDNEPALNLYKKYLGSLYEDLPASALRFPLNVWKDDDKNSLIRTLIAINTEDGSLTFVGNVPENSKAKLMKTNIDGLIDGSESAINKTGFLPNNQEAYCLTVSCIGRRLVLDQLTEEELVVIDDYLDEKVEISGFYSYGEIAPFSQDLNDCQFHNQTMTITVLQELL